MKRRIGKALIAMLAIACATSTAWAGKLGPEFKVNTTAQGNQYAPSVSKLGGGGFVVTWETYNSDSSKTNAIFGQRYTAAGERVGGEITVNAEAGSRQARSSVAGLRGGGFVVVWIRSWRNKRPRIVGQRFSQTGAPIGKAFFVDDPPSYVMGISKLRPSVAALSDSGFIVTWESQDITSEIYGQRFDAAGKRVGGVFRINTTTARDQKVPAVAALSAGGFVVIWKSYVDTGGYRFAVYGQLFSAAGVPIGGEFQISRLERVDYAKELGSPSIAELRGGGFVVAWGYAFGFMRGLYWKTFDAFGKPVGGQFQISHRWCINGEGQYVAGLRDGGFVIACNSATPKVLAGQRYNAAGARVGGAFRLNTTNFFVTTEPAFVGLDDGTFVAFWSAAQAGSNFDIYGQRFGK